MLKNYKQLLEYYENTDEFTAAIEYTSGRFNFRDNLVEKDFLCSMVLMYLYQDHGLPICFKGGTLLAKVYSGFYRLSEDLDFSISIPENAKRKERSAMVKPCKEIINNIHRYLPIFELSRPLTGTNESRQYNAELVYESRLWQHTERILIEIGLREPHRIQPIRNKSNTLLIDPFSQDAKVMPYDVYCLTQQEAYAEKTRAALTREKLAIRDFYDVAYAITHKLIDLGDKCFIQLVQQKLSLSNTKLITFDKDKIRYLHSKVDTELLPTINQNRDFQFELEAVIHQLQEFSEKNLIL